MFGSVSLKLSYLVHPQKKNYYVSTPQSELQETMVTRCNVYGCYPIHFSCSLSFIDHIYILKFMLIQHIYNKESTNPI